MSSFATKLIEWQAREGRHDLPWQASCDPYRVWLSEIMLQQTQVDTAIPFYLRFVARFPDLAGLAAADLHEVLAAWSGLGYYARARNLHTCARIVMQEHGGAFPRDAAQLQRLPGIGRSTAAAIAVFAFGARAAILDGNVKRVLCRCFGVEGFPGRARVEAELWALAESLLPENNTARYIQAQMDLGATLCTRGRPACERCPLRGQCVALSQARVAELPAPRPRKTRAARRVQVLVLREGGRVLLQRRPLAGVWGGLLSLPEFAEDSVDLPGWARREAGATALATRHLEPLRHGFTHFTLEILPLLLEVRIHEVRLREPGWAWLELSALAEAPLPAPVRQLLCALPAASELRHPAPGGADAGTSE